jgi:hypothetical protein
MCGGLVVSATLLLRIAFVISLLFAAGHTRGGLKKWSPMGENDVLEAMATVRFETMGTSRSYLDFFMGFGWSISVFMLLQTVLLWQIGSLARTDALQVRPLIVVIALANLASGMVAWRFIFPIPALFSGVLGLVLVAAYAVAK